LQKPTETGEERLKALNDWGQTRGQKVLFCDQNAGVEGKAVICTIPLLAKTAKLLEQKKQNRGEGSKKEKLTLGEQ